MVMGLRIERLSRLATRGTAFAVLTFGLLAFAFTASARSPQAKDGKAAQPSKDGGKAKVGLTLHDPKAYKGYNLFSPMNHTKTYLIDNDGKVVNMWTCDCEPGETAYLLPNGNLLRAGRVSSTNLTFNPPPGHGGRIQEYTWDGKLVWEYKFYNDKQIQHHDICPLPNGNVLLLVSERKAKADVIAAGRDEKFASDLMVDCLVEVKKTGKDTGEVVWEWHAWDHLVQDKYEAKANRGNAKDTALVNINFGSGALAALLANPADAAKLKQLGYAGGGGKKGASLEDWTHVNGIAYHPDLDQIMLSVHEFSEIWIIDHSTTTAQAKSREGGKSGQGGGILYRWGNPRAYGAGELADQQLYSQHAAHWIPKGSPGAGNILIFNNGLRRPGKDNFSSIEEIVPPVGPDGKYAKQTGKPFGPEKPAWTYTAPNKTDFYAMLLSGAQRLPNGNTLICVGTSGKLFEVTTTNDLVWEYQNPVSKGGAKAGGKGGPGAGGFGNSVFRVTRYSPDYPGLAGKQLTPGLSIEETLLTKNPKKG